MPPLDSQTPPRRLALKCPVCAASFRSVEICPRCGTNLQPLMTLAARAWALRRAARQHLLAGDLPAALNASAAAWKLQRAGVAAPTLSPK